MDFHEYIIKRKTGPKEILLSLLIYLGATVLSVVPLILLLPFGLSSIAVLLFFGCFYLAYRISTGMKKEFEYIFTQDSIRIDTILNSSRRKKIISFNLEEVEIIAAVEDNANNSLLKADYDKIIDATSHSSHATVYFATINAERRTLVKFEPPHNALKELFIYAPSKIKIYE